MEDELIRRACLIALAVVLLLAVALGVLLTVRSRAFMPDVGADAPFTLPPDPARSGDGAVSPARLAGSYNFLVVGVDRVAGLSDAVMLINLEASSGRIAVMQIPRDTYAELRPGQSGAKLNSALPVLGAEGLRELLESSLCVRVDYTAVVDLEAFTAAVDAVGGVELDVERDMDYEDPEQDLYIHLKAGRQLLDGEHAQQYVRFRSGYSTGDLGRVNAQKGFMSAFLSQLREKLTPGTAVQILRDVLPLVQTDLGIEECTYFAGIVLQKKASGKLVMMTAPGRPVSTGEQGGSFYVLGREAMREAVNDWFNVYDAPVPDAAFDPARVFLKEGDDDFERVYTYSLITVETVEN